MNLKAALLATTAGAFLFIAACGGDGGSSQFSSPKQDKLQYVAIDLGRGTGSGIAGGEQVGEGDTLFGSHPMLWRGNTSSVVDLSPKGFYSSWAYATDGTTQVGSGWPSANQQVWHALRWSGTPDSVVDLDPNGFRSEARGVAGDQIVGVNQTPTDGFHPVMWTSRGVVDLRPSGFDYYAVAEATDGTQQVGSGRPNGTTILHALLWSGSADSVVDLHPDGYCFSQALGVGGGQQVGVGGCGDTQTTADVRRALLWKGSAQSVVNLHPNGFSNSGAVAVAGGWQAGWGLTSTGQHALVWHGTADSVVDLHTFLPSGVKQSGASGIDASGNVVGSADGHAILWVRQ